MSTILERYPDYEVVIGMEVHVQLTTHSKIFCPCPVGTAEQPNSNICAVCAGHPGVLPVLNKQVVDYAIRAGLAINATIAPISAFARKHYFYPDLPKGYQITQSDRPICSAGKLPIRLEDGSIKYIRINRIHMEDDAGKNVHAPMSSESFVDLNRAGTPLLEIVSEPDIASAYETKQYLQALHLLVRSLNICTGNMEEGAFRADTNISVRKKGAPLGTKCELKNINSFKYIADAIEYEIERQITLLEEGGRIRQETRLWDNKNKETIVMRSKEEAADYRYFDDPDLPLLHISPEWIASVRATLPELPFAKFERFCAQGLSPYEADIIVNDLELADYYEAVYTHTQSKLAVNWILRNVMGYIKEHKLTFADCKVTPERLAQLVELIEKGIINSSAAQEVFEEVAATGAAPSDVVKSKGLEQIGSIDELDAIVKQVLADNPDNVAAYKAGKDKLFGFFVGVVMKQTRGKANPQIINDLLKKHLQ